MTLQDETTEKPPFETLTSDLAAELRQLIYEVLAVRVANKAGVAPGIVVGQLQHDRLIGYNTQLNGLKHRYKWVKSTLERA